MTADRSEGRGKVDGMNRMLQCTADRMSVAAFPELGAHQRPQTVAGDFVCADTESDQCIVVFFSEIGCLCQFLRHKKFLNRLCAMRRVRYKIPGFWLLSLEYHDTFSFPTVFLMYF